jgi:hypothetical protein
LVVILRLLLGPGKRATGGNTQPRGGEPVKSGPVAAAKQEVESRHAPTLTSPPGIE